MVTMKSSRGLPSIPEPWPTPAACDAVQPSSARSAPGAICRPSPPQRKPRSRLEIAPSLSALPVHTGHRNNSGRRLSPCSMPSSLKVLRHGSGLFELNVSHDHRCIAQWMSMTTQGILAIMTGSAISNALRILAGECFWARCVTPLIDGLTFERYRPQLPLLRIAGGPPVRRSSRLCRHRARQAQIATGDESDDPWRRCRQTRTVGMRLLALFGGARRRLRPCRDGDAGRCSLDPPDRNRGFKAPGSPSPTICRSTRSRCPG